MTDDSNQKYRPVKNRAVFSSQVLIYLDKFEVETRKSAVTNEIRSSRRFCITAR